LDVARFVHDDHPSVGRHVARALISDGVMFDNLHAFYTSDVSLFTDFMKRVR
jgi:hypothetical protein